MRADSYIKLANKIEFEDFSSKLAFIQNECIPDCKKDNSSPYISGLWLKDQGKIYYFKTVADLYSLVAELVGEKVSGYFHLDTVHYELASGIDRENRHVYGLASKYKADEQAEYHTWKKYLENKHVYGSVSVQDLKILDFFKQDFPNEPIVLQTKAFFIRELLTNEDDRLSNELLLAKKDKKISLGYLVDYATECRLPHRYFLRVPFCYQLSLRDDGVIEQIQNDEVFQFYVERALLFEIKKVLQEIKEEKSLLIPKSLEEEFIDFFSKSQSILKMYLKR